MIINKMLLIICVVFITSCQNKDTLRILDSDGDFIVECPSDTLGGIVTYYFKNQNKITFEYKDIIEFSRDDSFNAFLSQKADQFYGEERAEFGLNVALSILFLEDLSIAEIRLISRNLTPNQAIRIRELVKQSEGKWNFTPKAYNNQLYYLKIVRIQLF